ncbi:flavin reductase family protein [Bradyrhizobium sp. SSUT77]|uniref:flavin reductase family protein n=1 Tax=Bradyrhizobium sp. SSUT77 TaxID=3040603 RepID=UPI00244D0E9E|nr:flavin reductase family protein [Bradyrhizobium sp. SSUT77]MDH2348365.1 flavin reductase family protein [Bradyrhizobium sp. SSUT77]
MIFADRATTDQIPPITSDLFKSIMATAPGPATVVTSFTKDGAPCGLTMTAVCSVSLMPPLALACLSNSSNTLAALKETEAFSINYLTEGAEDLAMHFAKKSSSKFGTTEWSRPERGIGGPLLLTIAAYAACKVINIFDVGDHAVVIGEVVEGGVRAGAVALAYADRRFFSLANA